MSKENILNQLKDAVIAGDEEAAKKFAEESLKVGMDPLESIKKGLSEGMTIIGKQFRDGEIYLPQVILAADSMKAALDILEPKLVDEKRGIIKTGTVVIGTAFGDIHDIGKNIFAALLKTAGYEVFDLGTDVSNINFLNKAKEVNANVICVSALMTSSMMYQKDLIKDLADTGIREKFLVVVGGGAVTPKWASEIGVDGYGKHADDGVEVLNSLIKKEAKRPVLMEGGKTLT